MFVLLSRTTDTYEECPGQWEVRGVWRYLTIAKNEVAKFVELCKTDSSAFSHASEIEFNIVGIVGGETLDFRGGNETYRPEGCYTGVIRRWYDEFDQNGFVGTRLDVEVHTR